MQEYRCPKCNKKLAEVYRVPVFSCAMFGRCRYQKTKIIKDTITIKCPRCNSKIQF